LKTFVLAFVAVAVAARALVQGSQESKLELAERGDARSQTLLGLMCAKGEGVPKDSSEAAKWFRRAAEQGHSDAQFYIASMYLQGTGVPKDRIEAATWFLEAAAQGNTAAQYNLGVMYEKGEGVLLNRVAAYMWYNLAASHGLGESSPIGEEVHAAEQRDRLAQQMTSEEVNQAERLAREWVPARTD